MESQRRPEDASPGGPAAFARGEPLALLALFLALASLAQTYFVGGRFDCFDFYQFWWVGQAAHEEGTGDVWSAEVRAELGASGMQAAMAAQGPGEPRPRTRRAIAASRREVLETYSTPWLYTLFGVFAGGDYDRDLARFQVFSLLAFAAGVLALARLAGLSWAAALLILAALSAWFAPTLSDARVGNVNRLQVAALALYLVAPAWLPGRARDRAAGVVLGLAVLFKPNLAYPVLTLGLGWIALGRWRKLIDQAGGAVLGALAAVGLSSAWFGSLSAWSEWSAVLSELMGEYDHALGKGNFSLPRILDDAAGLGNTWVLTLGLLALFVAALLSRRARLTDPPEPAHEDLLLVGLGGALSLLTAKLAWLHYFLLIVPLLIVVLRPGAGRGVRLLGGAALLTLALEPLRDLSGLAESQPASAYLVCGGALLLFLVGLFDLSARGAARAS